jgi:hypothetical protein
MNSGIYWSSEENPDPLVPAKTYAYGITSMTENNAYITDDYSYSNNNVRAVKSFEFNKDGRSSSR